MRSCAARSKDRYAILTRCRLSLNWYFFTISPTDGTDIYMSNDHSSIPDWFTLSAYSGTIGGGASEQVTFTFKPAEMGCPLPHVKTCSDDYEWYFYQTGLDGEAVKIKVDLDRGTRAPTASPTTPSPTKAPTKQPTRAPSVSPTISQCKDGLKNGDETDLDCGGPDCHGCQFDEVCVVDRDCESSNCDGGSCGIKITSSPTKAPTTSPTSPPTASTCMDDVKNGDETDVDCGGPDCAGCDAGQDCLLNSDCDPGGCLDDNTCSVESPTASPTKSPTKNPTIAPTPTRTDAPTTSPTDAPTPGTCTDSSQGGSETDVDCGGPDCPGCADGEKCLEDRDCSSDSCDGVVCVAATQSPTKAPTTSPTTSAPTTSSPTNSPTTSSPTNSPTTSAPTNAPTASPTTPDCNSKLCSFHGRCFYEATVATCSCFPGYVGDRCELIETKEKKSQVVVDIYWGIEGIDRSKANEDYADGQPVYMKDFSLSNSASQLLLKDSCDYFRNTSSTMQVFPDGSDWKCMWEEFDKWLRKMGYEPLPLSGEDLITRLIGDEAGTVEGFFTRTAWWMGGKWLETWR